MIIVPPGAYFGEPWPSGICDTGQRIDNPGGNCAHCEEAIEPHHQGSFVYTPEGARGVHKECALRVALGGIGHHENHDLWCTQLHDPDGGRTRRQSAILVWELYGRRII